MRLPTRKLLTCPYCGGPPNNYKPIGMEGRHTNRVKVLVECWSGDLNKPSHHHLFVVTLKLNGFAKQIPDILYEEPPEIEVATSKTKAIGEK